MTEWIEHDGKGPPDLPAGTEVEVRFRDEEGEMVIEWDEYHSSDPRSSNWCHTGFWPEVDIVAYRVVRS